MPVKKQNKEIDLSTNSNKRSGVSGLNILSSTPLISEIVIGRTVPRSTGTLSSNVSTGGDAVISFSAFELREKKIAKILVEYFKGCKNELQKVKRTI